MSGRAAEFCQQHPRFYQELFFRVCPPSHVQQQGSLRIRCKCRMCAAGWAQARRRRRKEGTMVKRGASEFRGPRPAWPEEDIVRLRVLFAEGHSHAEMGRRLKRSKNAVTRKCDRLGLTRDTPIKQSKEPTHARRVRAGQSTLPPLGSLS